MDRRTAAELVYIGIKHSVVAIDRRDGNEVWRAKLLGMGFVAGVRGGEDGLLATNGGELFRRDPATGAILWRSKLQGLGRGLVSLTSERAASGARESRVQPSTAALLERATRRRAEDAGGAGG